MSVYGVHYSVTVANNGNTPLLFTLHAGPHKLYILPGQTKTYAMSERDAEPWFSVLSGLFSSADVTITIFDRYRQELRCYGDLVIGTDVERGDVSLPLRSLYVTGNVTVSGNGELFADNVTILGTLTTAGTALVKLTAGRVGDDVAVGAGTTFSATGVTFESDLTYTGNAAGTLVNVAVGGVYTAGSASRPSVS